MNSDVNWFFEKDTQWKEAYAELRKIILDYDLAEKLKWGKPCYTLKDKNVVLIHGFKDYCALLFHKGILFKDPAKILIQQTENVQSARQLRFSDLEEIKEQNDTIRDYLEEAIRVEKSGRKVKMKKTKDYPVPEEFQTKLDEDSNLEQAFRALTPGRQRGYLHYFANAKRSSTRERRIEKFIPKILDGKGKDD